MPDVVNVQHTRGASANIDATPLSNGQILYDHEAKRIFLDAVVDNELVRIAMKEGIFTGTELEWDALTDAQKAVFTYVNITDDYEFHSDVFVGATASTDGQVGLVTRPMAGDEGKYLKGDGTWGAIDQSSKADKVSGATNGNFAGLDANGNLTDSGSKASDFAAPSDIPTALSALSEDSTHRVVTDTEKTTWNGKSTVTIGTTGTASSTVVSYQQVGINGSNTAIKGTMYMLISNTSSTSYAFTNSNITTSSSIDVYTDTYGDNPSNVTISGNTCTVTFSAAKTRSVKIYIR